MCQSFSFHTCRDESLWTLHIKGSSLEATFTALWLLERPLLYKSGDGWVRVVVLLNCLCSVLQPVLVMEKVLILSDGSCQDLPVPTQHVTVMALDSLTLGSLLQLLQVCPDIVEREDYDIVIVHVGAHNIKHVLSVRTLVSLLDLLVLKLRSLCPCAKVVVSSIVPWHGCTSEELTHIQDTNWALSQHFGKQGFIKSYFNLIRGGKARADMFAGEGFHLNARGKACLWTAFENFLHYISARWGVRRSDWLHKTALFRALTSCQEILCLFSLPMVFLHYM